MVWQAQAELRGAAFEGLRWLRAALFLPPLLGALPAAGIAAARHSYVRWRDTWEMAGRCGQSLSALLIVAASDVAPDDMPALRVYYGARGLVFIPLCYIAHGLLSQVVMPVHAPMALTQATWEIAAFALLPGSIDGRVAAAVLCCGWVASCVAVWHVDLRLRRQFEADAGSAGHTARRRSPAAG
jgi:hypothetical protein